MQHTRPVQHVTEHVHQLAARVRLAVRSNARDALPPHGGLLLARHARLPDGDRRLPGGGQRNAPSAQKGHSVGVQRRGRLHERGSGVGEPPPETAPYLIFALAFRRSAQ